MGSLGNVCPVLARNGEIKGAPIEIHIEKTPEIKKTYTVLGLRGPLDRNWGGAIDGRVT